MQGDEKLQVESLDGKPEVMDLEGAASASIAKVKGRLWPWILGITFMLAVITSLVTYFLIHKPKPQVNQQQPNAVASQSVNTALLSPIASTFSSPNANSVVVNGQLQAANSIIILPTAQPTKPTLGQMYLDQTNHNLYFYNGTSFTSLGQTVTNVTNITNTAATGVASVQGQTGNVTLNGGTGINVSGTTIGVNNLVTLQGNAFNGPSELVQLDGSSNLNLGGNLVLGNGGTVFSNNLSQTAAGQNVNISAGSDVITFTAGGINFTFPTSGGNTQQICTTAVTCVAGGGQAVLLAPGANPQSNASATDASIFLRNTSTANLLQLQHNTNNVFVIDTNGNTTINSGTLTVSALSSGVATIGIGGTLSSVTALPVTNGGTGATTAASARSNLSAAISGANNDITSTSALNTITPSGTLTIGSTAQQFTLQGSSTSAFTATSGSNVATLNFATPTANHTITIPNETGTICTTAGSAACAAVYQAAGSYVSLQVSTPGSPQTGNLNLSGTGILGTSVLTPTLDTPSGTTSLNIGTVNATNGINLNQNTSLASNKSFTANGSALFKDATNSASAFQIQNATGNQILTGDTSGNQIILGKAGTLNGQLSVATSGGGSVTLQPTASASNFTITLPSATGTVCLQNASSCGFATGSGNAFIQGGNAFGATGTIGLTDNNTLNVITNNATRLSISGAGATTITAGTVGNPDALTINNSTSTGNIVVAQDNGANVLKIAHGGATTLSNSVNSSSALQIQNATVEPVLTVGTNATANLITNGNFETNITGWSAKGAASLSRTTAHAYLGTGALQVVTTTTAGNANCNTGNPAATSCDGASYPFSFTNGTAYTFTAYVRLASGTATSMRIGHVDGGVDVDCLNGIGIQTPNFSISSSGWTSFSCSFTASTTTAVYFKQGDNTVRTYYIDNAGLQASGTGTHSSVLGTVNFNAEVTSPLLVQPIEDSSTTLSVLGSNGSDVFNVDTLNQQVSAISSVGTALTALSTTSYGVQATTTNGSSYGLLGLSISGGGGVQGAGTTLSSGFFENSTSINTSPTLVTALANGQTADLFQAQNNTGQNLVAIKNTGDIVFNPDNAPGTAHFINVSAQSLTNIGGKFLTVAAGDGNGTAVGGQLSLLGGNGGNSNANGGNVLIDAGTKSGSGINGTISVGATNASAVSIGNTSGTIVIQGNNSAGSVSIQSNGGTIAVGTANQNVVNIGSTNGSTSVSIQAGSVLNLGTGAVGNTITLGNSTAATTLTLQSGSTATAIQILQSAGGVITIGNNGGTSAVTVTCGTGTCNFGNGTSAHSVLINNTVGASTTTIQSGTGGIALQPASTGVISLGTTNNNTVSAGGDLSFITGLNHTIRVVDQTTLNGNGNNLTVITAAGNSTGNGGQLSLQGGAGGSLGGTGGLVQITGGTSHISVAGFTSGSADVTIAGGPVSGFNATGATLTLKGAVAGFGNGVGGGATLQGGSGDVSGNGGSISIIGGTGASTSGSGGSVLISGGAKGTGGSSGNVVVQPQAGNDTTSSFEIQNAAGANLFNVDSSTTQNKIVGGFESSTLNGSWNAMNGATLSITSSFQIQGNNALQIATSTSAGSGALYIVSASSSTQYTLSFWAKLISGSMSTFEFGHQDSGGGPTSCATGQTVTTTWTFYTCTYTTGTVSGFPDVYFKQTDAPGVGRNIIMDAVQLEQGSTATIFNPGGQLQLLGTLNSPVTIRPKTDSSQVFQVQNSAGTTTLFGIDTTGNGTVSLQTSASGTINIGTVNSLSVVIGKSGGTGTLTVNGASTFNGNLTFNGHIISGNSSGTTTVSVGTIAGCIDASNGTVTLVSGNDTAGIVDITTGNTCGASGQLANVNFANSYGGFGPTVELTPGNVNAATLGGYYIGGQSSTTFGIATVNTPLANHTYRYDYHVIN